MRPRLEFKFEMASERPRRVTAGKNIGKLINQELGADEFYTSAYGGFEEVSGDEEYETEDSEDDVVDSDFDVEEEPEGEEQDEDFEPLRKKKKQWIKPYRPAKVDIYGAQQPGPPPPRRKHRAVALSPASPDESSEHRSLRRSTMEISEEYRRRRYEEQYRRKVSTVRKAKPRPALTQEQMLAEARITEIENLASLEAYTRMEAEKKKVKEKKAILQGPIVRMLSVTMPLIPELADSGGNKTFAESSSNSISTVGSSGVCKDQFSLASAVQSAASHSTVPGSDASMSQQLRQSDPVGSNVGSVQDSTQPTSTSTHPTSSDDALRLEKNVKVPDKYCRNFLIFTDTNSFPKAYFSSSKPPKPRKIFCPVTGLPAKYIDPLTNTPYATPQAFKIIRNRYVNEGEQKCEKRLLQLSSWLEEKKKKKLEAKFYI